jgi:NADP-reducing hydrogenase subunit HndC
MVNLAKFYLGFTVDESCGKCTPCRIGTKRLLEILTRLTDGKGEEGDIEKLEELSESICKASVCGLGQTAPNPVLSTIKYFRDEYEAHIKDKKCPAAECKKLMDVHIIPELCKGCDICRKNCPVNAISGEPGKVHVVDPSKCIKCGTCISKCPFHAIKG